MFEQIKLLEYVSFGSGIQKNSGYIFLMHSSHIYGRGKSLLKKKQNNCVKMECKTIFDGGFAVKVSLSDMALPFCLGDNTVLQH